MSYGHLLVDGSDIAFRGALYRMVRTLGTLIDCREAFGRAMGLTGSQFVVIIGVAYQQGTDGVSIRQLADHIHIASTHVTTEVGRLMRKGLLVKRANLQDKRSVLVSLSAKGEQAIDAVTPFVREINDHLFQGFSQAEFEAQDAFMTRFAENGARALAAIERAEAGRDAAPGRQTSRRRKA
ncbi:MarR family winged helix-turn-helix transcriptional regulator [Roseomonas chloroacetimidivorans]|uniref:MarR family winged helix-turn-helix transcriptional regulator n=1 Tax=Roseomonas chloroacetimidivorans TaxID=1766656 RepID=UPI003C72BAFF